MSIYIPKSKLQQRLLNNSYYIGDNTDTSPNYFDVTYFPSTIGGGKSLIKIKGNGQYLKLGSDIDVEILDSAGNPMYWEIVNLIDRFFQYYISIYVYDTTAEGVGTVILTGEASRDLNGNAVPAEWVGKHNIIWTRSIEIKPLERNNSEIVFSTPPHVTVDQTTLPERVSSGSLSQGTYTTTTAQNIFTITTANFAGFDKIIAQDGGITDLDIQSRTINPTQQPRTTNTVDTTTRIAIKNGANAYQINKTNRYNTILKTSQPFFSASHIGGIFEISGSIPTTLSPSLPAGYATTGSITTQLLSYYSRIVDVLNDQTAILEIPVTVKAYNTANIAKDGNITTFDWTYKLLSGSFSGRVTYAPVTAEYVTSSIVQNYVEFVYSDLNPVGGQVYKVRPFYKLTGRQADYWLLNDQIIKPIEFLADPRYPNQTTYAKDQSDYYLYGHFVESSALTNNWDISTESPIGIGGPATPILDNSIQLASTRLIASQSNTTILVTKYYQNYLGNTQYTFSTYLTLDPGCELEVYMNSVPLQSANILTNNTILSAFDATANLERGRYGDAYNRFGKFVGKITNNTNQRVYYGKVGFDFLADADGLGRPLIRVKSADYTTTGSAYLSQLSINATTLNGFTPNLVKFTIPFALFPQISLSQSLDFKLEYYDYTGNQSEYVTYLSDVTLNISSQAVSPGCQAEAYSWSFDARTYHASTQSYSESVNLTNPPPLNFDYTTDIPLYTYYTTASTADLILSSSKTTYKWWPFIEDISGLYISGSSFGLVPIYSVGGTYNGINGHIVNYTQKYKFTTGFDMFGIRYSNSDVSLWNVRRPIMKDSNTNPYLNPGYAQTFYLEDGTTPATDTNLLTGIIPANSPGVFYVYNTQKVGTGSIVHTNEYPPYTASADPTWIYNGMAGAWVYHTPDNWYYGSWQGKVTSSWNWVSAYTENLGTYYMPKWSSHSIVYTSSLDIYATGSYLADHFASRSAALPLAHYSRSLQTSSIDNRWFAYEGCLGITRDMVSESFASYSRAGATNAQKTEALKKRRLMFPMNGTATGSYFTTNGGVYDVRFKVKQYGNYRPDNGSFMDIYIFNANADFTSETPGTAGWRPPASNVVTIGNGYSGLPIFSNYDPTTGAYYDEYQITLTQYGTPAQIVFEPMGVPSNDAYFGILIDDVSFCKIGITTDPTLIGPTSVYDIWTNINSGGPGPSTIGDDVLVALRGGTF